MSTTSRKNKFDVRSPIRHQELLLGEKERALVVNTCVRQGPLALFIMMHEPPAFVFGESGTKYLFHWHYGRGATTLTSGKLKQDNQKFFSAILFVDGHASKHDFTKAIKEDLNHPLEPTANWIWYKPE